MRTAVEVMAPRCASAIGAANAIPRVQVHVSRAAVVGMQNQDVFMAGQKGLSQFANADMPGSFSPGGSAGDCRGPSLFTPQVDATLVRYPCNTP